MDRRLDKVCKTRPTYKPFIVPQNTESTEGWRDPRTGIRLAPGGTQNWPTNEDEVYIRSCYSYMYSVKRHFTVVNAAHAC